MINRIIKEKENGNFFGSNKEQMQVDFTMMMGLKLENGQNCLKIFGSKMNLNSNRKAKIFYEGEY